MGTSHGPRPVRNSHGTSPPSETLQTCSNPIALCNAFVAGTGLGSPPGPVL